MRLDPGAFADLISGSMLYRTRVVLDSLSVPDDSLALDVIDGAYREDAAGIPQAELVADLYLEDTDPAVFDLLQPTDTRVRVTCILSTPDGATTLEVPLVPMWLQSVETRTDATGRHYTITAVDLLGRLSANGLQNPVQTSGGVAAGITALLNTAGHPQTVTVTGSDGGTSASGDIFDGDPAQAAAELADQAGKMLRTTGQNTVALIDTPGAATGPTTLDAVTAYTVVTARGPSKVIVQGRDGRQVAGGAGGSRYGTVTRLFTRTQAIGAAGLLRRVGGLRTYLTDVELLPAPWLEWGDPVKVARDDAPNARIWALDLPLAPGPMRLTMRTPEDVA